MKHDIELLEKNMISNSQIRAALGALHWSQQGLADRVNLSVRTIHTMLKDDSGLPNIKLAKVFEIKQAFEKGDAKLGLRIRFFERNGNPAIEIEPLEK